MSPVSRERGVKRQQGEVWRMIGAVKPEAPAEGGGSRGKTVAMAPEPGGIIVTDAFDATDNHLVAVLEAFKTDAPVER